MHERRTTKARPRLRARLPRTLARMPVAAALLLGLFAGCGPPGTDAQGLAVPEPPVPPDLDEFDPRAAVRIRAGLARVAADGHSAAAWGELGALYTSERLKGQAIECFEVAERLDPSQPKWPYRLGIMLAQSGALGAAQAAMQRSLALEPDYPPSHARLGNSCLDLGDLDGAERSFRAAIERDSTYPGGWWGLARVELQRDRPAAAIAILERLTAEDPGSRAFRHLLASARRQLDPAAPLAAESALPDEETQVWNDPWELETRAFARQPTMLTVGLLLEHGRAEEALVLLAEERARGRDPDELALLFATAHLRLGQPAEARRELAALLARQPDSVRALLLHAELQDDAGDLRGAVQTLERVTVLQPGQGAYFAAKASKLAQLKQFEPARAAYLRALELGVHDYELQRGLGNCLVFLRRWPEALELFEAMLRERPDDGDVWLQFALAQLRSGALREAEQALARARATGKTSQKLLHDVEAAITGARARRQESGQDEPR